MAKDENKEIEQGTLGLENEVPMESTSSPTKSKKDAYMEGFKSKHPDWQDDDEEGFYGALTDDAAAMDEEMNGYRTREDEMTSVLSGNPLNAKLFVAAANGTPIPLALLKEYPEEMKSWMQDPTNTDLLEQTFQEHADKIEENKKLQAEADKNLEETNAMLDQMIADGELADEEELNSTLEFLANIAAGLMVNHVEKEWIIAAKKAMNHDADVMAAKTQGEIDGRNSKITAQRKDANRGGTTHTGLGTSNAGQRLSRNETQAATGRGQRRSMWDGGRTNSLE